VLRSFADECERQGDVEMIYIISIVFMVMTSLNVAASQSMVVIGDSACTGAAAHPDLNLGSLVALSNPQGGAQGLTKKPLSVEHLSQAELFNITDTIPALTRLWPEIKYRSDNPLERFAQKAEHMAMIAGSQLLDTAEYSWPSLLGAMLGLEQDTVLLTALDGKRVDNIDEQLKAFAYNTQSKQLPRYVFVLFVANDLCHEKVFKGTEQERVIEYYNRYLNKLSSALEEMATDYLSHPMGTKVLVLTSLNVAKVMTERSILEKTVPIATENVSPSTAQCVDFRAPQPPESWQGSSRHIHAKLKQMCNSVLQTQANGVDWNQWSSESKERVRRIDIIHQAHVHAQKDAVTEVAIKQIRDKEFAQGFEFVFVPDTYELKFGAEHIANDCFHPSVQGHELIAKTVYDFLQRNEHLD
jgi:lysophospholipase L1-like esterase